MLFVYGVDQAMEKDAIQIEFERFGMVTDVYNSQKGYAFVTFSTEEEANNCISELDGGTVGGHPVKVSVAKPKGEGGRGRGRGGYGGGRGGYGGYGDSGYGQQGGYGGYGGQGGYGGRREVMADRVAMADRVVMAVNKAAMEPNREAMADKEAMADNTKVQHLLGPVSLHLPW